MEHKFAEELYSENLRLSHLELHPSSAAHNDHQFLGNDDSELMDKDALVWDDSDEVFGESSDLDREWQRRHDQFYTIGYRDGLIAGKEASAQEGFNIGFKQSVPIGYNWGLVKGATSAFACLPDVLKERLVEDQGHRDKFQDLYKSVNSLSTPDALKLFSDEMMSDKTTQESQAAEASSLTVGPKVQTSASSRLGSYFAELRSVLIECPAIDVRLDMSP
ncbi:Yae1_N domain-containing protein [Psidium guajava]|nr:Yae1_N domain-containing protein [Psidium guajava]